MGAEQQEDLRELEVARDELDQLQWFAAVGAWSWDFETDRVVLSSGAAAALGVESGAGTYPFAPTFDFVHPDDRAALTAELDRLRAEGGTFRRITRLRRPDGEVRVVDGWTEAVRGETGEVRGMRGVLQDVTDRTRDEQFREAMLATTRAVAEADGIEEAIEGVLAAVAESTGWQAATFWLVDDTGERLCCEKFWVAPGKEDELRDLALATAALDFGRGDGVPGSAWEAREPVWRDVDPADDGASYPRRETAERAGLSGVLAFPLVSRERVIGVIDVWRTEPGRPPDELVQLLGSIGSQVGQFVDRMRAEGDARKSRELAVRIVEEAQDAVVTIDEAGTVLAFNPAAEQTFGYSSEEAIGRELAELVVPPRYRDRHRRGLARLRDGGEPTLLGRRIELEAFRADGSVFPVELTIGLLTDDPPTYTGWVRDITERRRAEQALLDSRRLLAQTQSLAEIGGWEWAVDYDSVTAADEVYALLGLEPSPVPVPLSHLLSRIQADHRDRLRARIEACARDGTTLRHERVPLVVPVGDVRIVEWFAERVESGEESLVRGTVQNITPEAELEAELANRARQQAAVAQFGSEALVAHDFAALVESAVETVARILEIPNTAVMELLPGGEELLLRAGVGWQDGMVGKFVVRAGVRSHAGYVIAIGEAVVSEDVRTDQRFEVPPELIRHGLVSCAAVVIASDAGSFGTLGAYAAEGRRFSADDVSFLQGMANVLAAAFASERAADLERQLQQAQRLDSVGKLAGGIAHDFNNLLSVILNYADFAYEETESLAARSEIDEIKRAAERAAELTRQLLLFSRKDVTSEEIVDPGAAIGGMETILRRTLGEHLQIDLRLPTDPWPVRIAGSLLEQVLLNLVLNARDAMPQGGQIAVEVANVPAQRQAEGGSSAEGPQVRLSVIDSGTGMEPDVVDRVFEPFFTTKPEGEGTGLGLATAYGIVQRAGGTIEIESAPGEGTAVHVHVPASIGAEEGGPPGPAATTGTGGGETILLVEDEEAVRRLTRRILEGAGYLVLAADGPDAAVDLWSAHAAQIDLLLTDVVMPGRSGVRLWHELVEQRADLRVVYMSGYAGDVISEVDGVEEAGTLLQKPFSSAELLGVVRAALSSRQASR